LEHDVNWQTWATIIAVGCASVYIGRRFYRSIRTRTGGGCGHDCGRSSKRDFGIQRQQIIPVDELKSKSHAGSE